MRLHGIDWIAEHADYSAFRCKLSNPFAGIIRREISGCHLTHGTMVLGILVVGEVPINAAVKMGVEKTSFLGGTRQIGLLAQDIVKPAGAGSRWSDNEE